METGGDLVEKRKWHPGKLLVADTSFVHRTLNESPTEDRYVLHFSIWHPDLTTEEQQGIVDMHEVLQEFESGMRLPEHTLK